MNGLEAMPIRRRASAVSQTLAAIREDLEMRAAPLPFGESARYRMRLCFNGLLRHRALSLAYRVYKACGYAQDCASGLAACDYDARPETATFLAEDAEGRAIATVTLVFDEAQGLPSDEIFAAELAAPRAEGRRLVEVTRLAMDPAHAHSKELLVRLFNVIYLHARMVMGRDGFVIEVNPRHVNYYRRLLGFVPLGEARPCPRVLGAPAVLLALDFAYTDAEVARLAGQPATGVRSLYPYFLPAEPAARAVDWLKAAKPSASGRIPVPNPDCNHL
ncbi:MAG: hypothetical protein L6R28_06490 [Planctomycetes bacterium]|nr:hypothetical protein [Planctomycetota bacterium]